MLEIIFGLMTILSAAYYVYCGIKTQFKCEILSFWLISSVIFSFFYFYVRFLSGIIFSVLFVILLYLVSLFILITATFFVGSFIVSKKDLEAERFVVFGADNVFLPKTVFKNRLECAVGKLCGNDKAVIVSGNGKIKEAQFGRKFLLNRGIEEERIIVETKSDTTLQNIVNTAKFCNGDFAVITSRFHAMRTRIIFGILFPEKKVKIIGTNDVGLLELHMITREIICLFYDLLSGRIKAAKSLVSAKNENN